MATYPSQRTERVLLQCGCYVHVAPRTVGIWQQENGKDLLIACGHHGQQHIIEAMVLPKNITVGTRMMALVPERPNASELECEVLAIKKTQRCGVMKYAITIVVPDAWQKRKTTRYFGPKDRIRVTA